MPVNIIYILRNTINNKVYVGQTWQSLDQRMNSTGYRRSKHLYAAIQKYGKEVFYYETLTFCFTQEAADKCEIYFINKHNSNNKKKGYNLRGGGSRGRHSEETKRKMSIAQQGNKNHMFGKRRPLEWNLAHSKRMSGENNPSFGKTGQNSFNFGKVGHNFGKTWKLVNGKRVWMVK